MFGVYTSAPEVFPSWEAPSCSYGTKSVAGFILHEVEEPPTNHDLRGANIERSEANADNLGQPDRSALDSVVIRQSITRHLDVALRKKDSTDASRDANTTMVKITKRPDRPWSMKKAKIRNAKRTTRKARSFGDISGTGTGSPRRLRRVLAWGNLYTSRDSSALGDERGSRRTRVSPSQCCGRTLTFACRRRGGGSGGPTKSMPQVVWSSTTAAARFRAS